MQSEKLGNTGSDNKFLQYSHQVGGLTILYTDPCGDCWWHVLNFFRGEPGSMTPYDKVYQGYGKLRDAFIEKMKDVQYQKMKHYLHPDMTMADVIFSRCNGDYEAWAKSFRSKNVWAQFDEIYMSCYIFQISMEIMVPLDFEDWLPQGIPRHSVGQYCVLSITPPKSKFQGRAWYQGKNHFNVVLEHQKQGQIIRDISEPGKADILTRNCEPTVQKDEETSTTKDVTKIIEGISPGPAILVNNVESDVKYEGKSTENDSSTTAEENSPSRTDEIQILMEKVEDAVKSQEQSTDNESSKVPRKDEHFIQKNPIKTQEECIEKDFLKVIERISAPRWVDIAMRCMEPTVNIKDKSIEKEVPKVMRENSQPRKDDILNRAVESIVNNKEEFIPKDVAKVIEQISAPREDEMLMEKNTTKTDEQYVEAAAPKVTEENAEPCEVEFVEMLTEKVEFMVKHEEAVVENDTVKPIEQNSEPPKDNVLMQNVDPMVEHEERLLETELPQAVEEIPKLFQDRSTPITRKKNTSTNQHGTQNKSKKLQGTKTKLAFKPKHNSFQLRKFQPDVNSLSFHDFEIELERCLSGTRIFSLSYLKTVLRLQTTKVYNIPKSISRTLDYFVPAKVATITESLFSKRRDHKKKSTKTKNIVSKKTSTKKLNYGKKNRNGKKNKTKPPKKTSCTHHQIQNCRNKHDQGAHINILILRIKTIGENILISKYPSKESVNKFGGFFWCVLRFLFAAAMSFTMSPDKRPCCYDLFSCTDEGLPPQIMYNQESFTGHHDETLNAPQEKGLIHYDDSDPIDHCILTSDMIGMSFLQSDAVSMLSGKATQEDDFLEAAQADNIQVSELPSAEPVEAPSVVTEKKTDPRLQWATADCQRGIGIILVVLYHMGYDLANNAWMDISMFFSLSGFLITKTTVESYERNGRVNMIQFWAKRVSRLFPVLLLTVTAIALSQELPWRSDDGVNFQRERTDLFYATVFATNYNLVYNQVDDYFDETSAPSVTRHMWTLSIEEQYYIIWPVVIFLLTTLVGHLNGSPGKSVGKRHLWAIFVLDLIVILSSFLSSFATIEKLGISAAYYSTWCRMGDIALGGAFYSISRLNPWIALRLYGGGGPSVSKDQHASRQSVLVPDSRNKHDTSNESQDVPPMTLGQKIACEVLAQFGLLIVVGMAMLQTPVEKMFPLYFGGLRFVASIPISSIIAVALLHAEEGSLPDWAVATKVWSSPKLAFLGHISYGTYLFHWPLIVYFGDPLASDRKAAEEMGLEPGGSLDYRFRDFLIFTVAFFMGAVSFLFFEKPFMMKSRKTKPPVTVLTGFCAMGLTMMIIWSVTRNLAPMTTYENDVDQVFGGVAGTSPSCNTWCTDDPSHHMITKNQECNATDFDVEKCDKTNWINEKYCQETCWERGHGYADVECCLRKKWNPITMTVIGESVAARLGILFKGIVEDLDPLQGDIDFPAIEVTKLGMAGHMAINYFACLSNDPKYQYDACRFENFEENEPQMIVSSIEVTKPDVVVIHDGHWSPGVPAGQDLNPVDLHSDFEKVLAFNMLLKNAMENGAESVFFLTSKISKESNYYSRMPCAVTGIGHCYALEMNHIMNVVDALSCSEDNIDSAGIRLTVVDWAKLVCPEIGRVNSLQELHAFNTCKEAQHGFDNILPDGMHPKGDSGWWLARNVFAVILDELAQHSLPIEYRSAYPMANPVSKYLLNLSPPDGDPELKDLVSSHYLCPQSDLETLRAHFNEIEAYDGLHYPGIRP